MSKAKKKDLLLLQTAMKRHKVVVVLVPVARCAMILMLEVPLP